MSLTELEMRILAELDEAGEENFTALLNTVLSPIGAATEIEQYQSALRQLVERDYARMSTARDETGALVALSQTSSKQIIAEIASFLVFRIQENLWTDARRKGPPYSDSLLHVINTPTGRRAGAEILDRRGYQWWRARNR